MSLLRRSTTDQDPLNRHRLRLREIHGHVTVTPTTLTAWFLLGHQRWSFTTDQQREGLIHSYARGLAALAGHTVHLRVTDRPYPAHLWAQRLDANTPAPLGGRGPDSPWADHLVTAQEALRKSTLSDKEVFIGIDLPRKRNTRNRTRSVVSGDDGARYEIGQHTTKLRRLAEIVAQPGMNGRPAHTEELEWLIHRSVRLGLPATTPLSPIEGESWEEADMAAFTEGVEYRYERFGPTVEVTADYRGTPATRHVAVMSVGRMGALQIPQVVRDPWMQHTDHLPFAVEWASTFKVLAGPEAGKETARKRLALRDQQRHYAEHGIEEPLALQRKADQARRIEDETTEGDLVEAARCYGWHRIAVSGRTAEECLARVQAVQDTYAGQQISVVHPRTLNDAAAQLPLLREFIPGEPVSSGAYQRRLPALYLAAGLPHVSASVGDRLGPYFGYTCGTSRHAFMFDLFHPMEVRESSGLVPLVGGLGSGKSHLMGDLAYEHVLRGITTTLLDPSGPLARLCEMPRLRNYARHLDLVDGQDGLLSPWAVIAEPERENYETDDQWAEARVYAEQHRKMLASDVVKMLLPVKVADDAQTELMLSEARRSVGGARDKSLWDIVEALENRTDANSHARNLANYLRDMAELPQSRLFFPKGDRDTSTPTETLLVLTMSGLQVPSADQPRNTWSTAEQIAVPLLHLASHFATTRAYGLDRHERKIIGLDEVGLMQQWGSGRALFNRLGRDSRKWNIAALVASQSPNDILGLDVAMYVSTSFVGRIEDESTARDALRMLRIKEGAGYEEVLGALSPHVIGDAKTTRGAREFIVKDVLSNVERVRIDTSHLPELEAALNTTPAGRTRILAGVAS